MDDYLRTGGVQNNLEILSRPNKPENLYNSNSSTIKKNHSSRDHLLLKGYGRQWGEKFTYSVGLAYGSGISLGGTYGLLCGIRKGGKTPKLFANSILNSCAVNGPALANRFSVITIFYCGFKNIVNLINEDDSVINSAVSGLLSGSLFRCTYGIGSMLKYAALSSVVFSAIDYSFKEGYI